jgi:hypothetical protein
VSLKLIIDGDILVYRAGFSKNATSEEAACQELHDLVNSIVNECIAFPKSGDFIIYLTGSTNFRHAIAVSHPYKGNRKGSGKPEHFNAIRQYIIDKFPTEISIDEEADDLIAIMATKVGPSVIVATTDKDMQQLVCKHYNPRTGIHSVVNKFEALLSFYTQLLTGDTVDNIKCIKGVGPKKAEKLLAECRSEGELYLTCVRAYEDAGEAPERLLENARLLHLRRVEGELWEPPVVRL